MQKHLFCSFFVIKWKGCWKMHSDEEIFKETTPKALLQLL
ncbi:Crp/Fnr family transcriptional regulator, partial [Listeria monocytogenes]|nr:Crp/Fnr family transcriptional regulator [Listeria monocytogenes]EAF4076602.1 Crp/Fnr family transcriptional regulator [Listeria monocytogenes]EAH1784873.1 Crp/Fnr family transcriptional regulator [Listeria monocytogenes]EAH2900309.1 Crp/Fnr family transcriptional regulator [Listeria monocytogenes]